MRQGFLFFIFCAGAAHAQVSVAVPKTDAVLGTAFFFALQIDETDGLGIESFTFDLNFDEEVAALTGVRLENTLAQGWNFSLNLGNPGQLIVSAAGTTPLSGAGPLLFIEGLALTAGKSNLEMGQWVFNEGQPSAAIQNGILVVRPNQAPSSLILEPTGDQTIRVGESVFFAGSGTDPEGMPLTYRWVLGDHEVLSTQAQPGLLVFNQPGRFVVNLWVTDQLGLTSAVPANRQINVVHCPDVRLLPPAIAQGLSPIAITAEMPCDAPEVDWVWQDLTTGVLFGSGQNPVLINPGLSQTTVFEITVTDQFSLETGTAQTVILVADDPQFQDFNGDGCNSSADFFSALPLWRTDLADANSDDLMTIADFLFIQLPDTDFCEP